MEVIVWQCKSCKDIVVSYAREHHVSNKCKCGKSFMDLEDYGCRGTELKTLGELDDDDYAINLELITNYGLQIGEYEQLEGEDRKIELMLYGRNKNYILDIHTKMLRTIKNDIYKQLV